MTLKIVQGLIGTNSLLSRSPQLNNQVQNSAQAQGVASAVQRAAASSDAAINQLRSINRSGHERLKLESEDKAEALSNKIASRIKSEKEEALSAHSGLDGISPRDSSELLR